MSFKGWLDLQLWFRWFPAYPSIIIPKLVKDWGLIEVNICSKKGRKNILFSGILYTNASNEQLTHNSDWMLTSFTPISTHSIAPWHSMPPTIIPRTNCQFKNIKYLFFFIIFWINQRKCCRKRRRVKQAVMWSWLEASSWAEEMTSGRRKQKGITENGKRVYGGNGEGYKKSLDSEMTVLLYGNTFLSEGWHQYVAQTWWLTIVTLN